MALLLALTAPAFAQDDIQVDFTWGVTIPMRDGVRVNATLYRPVDMTEPLPVVFTQTPYISDTYHERGMYFAGHGYVFAVVDVRGRGNSEGTFVPFVNDAQDGYDTVEWLARQPWSNGKVAMWGGSYAGFNQWTALKERPPHLATIVPAAAAHAATDFPFFHNVYVPYIMRWLTYTSGAASNGNIFGDDSFWVNRFTKHRTEHLPFRALDSVVGNMSTVYQTWLEHPTPDAYWDALVPTPEQYRAIDVPILTITGHYDGDQPGAMEYYVRHMRYGTPSAAANHYLIAGPWDHAGTRTPRAEVGGLTFGDASLLDLNDLHRQWYDWTMKDGPKPEFLKDRIAYYVVGSGAEQWKYAPSLEAIGSETRMLHLNALGDPGDVFTSGTLGEMRDPTTSTYTYNPLDTSRVAFEQEQVADYITDQSVVLRLRGDGLVYHTAPFEAATELSGYVKLVLWMSLDVPDTDFAVSLYEILPDGSSVQLTYDVKRARYRNSLRNEELVTPGELNEYVFDTFMFFSRRISEGSRLRLVITAPNYIQVQQNYNSGGSVVDESVADAKVAHITIYHGGQHASYLEIPVVHDP
jgi:putative CocE/NonD family hydrolase